MAGVPSVWSCFTLTLVVVVMAVAVVVQEAGGVRILMLHPTSTRCHKNFFTLTTENQAQRNHTVSGEHPAATVDSTFSWEWFRCGSFPLLNVEFITMDLLAVRDTNRIVHIFVEVRCSFVLFAASPTVLCLWLDRQCSGQNWVRNFSDLINIREVFMAVEAFNKGVPNVFSSSTLETTRKLLPSVTTFADDQIQSIVREGVSD